MAVQSAVPVALFSRTLIRGTITPSAAVVFIHTVAEMVAPLGILPATPGSPAVVLNSATAFSPAAVLCRLAVCKATAATSGAAVLSCLNPAVADASL